jgi:hypothetical protein
MGLALLVRTAGLGLFSPFLARLHRVPAPRALIACADMADPLFSLFQGPPPSDKKSLFGRRGHTPAVTCLKERFHGGEGSKDRLEGASTARSVLRAGQVSLMPFLRPDPGRGTAWAV